jgi:hypothetical protein
LGKGDRRAVDEANVGLANEGFERFLKRGVEAPPPAKGSLFEGAGGYAD